jgi:hypothetical protein
LFNALAVVTAMVIPVMVLIEFLFGPTYVKRVLAFGAMLHPGSRLRHAGKIPRRLPPTAKDAPTRDEMAAATEPADQNQTEISVRPVHHARAEIRPVQNPRKKVRQAQTARAEIPPAQDARAQEQPMQNFLQIFGSRN